MICCGGWDITHEIMNNLNAGWSGIWGEGETRRMSGIMGRGGGE